MKWGFLFFLLLSGYTLHSQDLFSAAREERVAQIAAWNALTPFQKEAIALHMAEQDSLIEARTIWNNLIQSAPTPLPPHWVVRRDSVDALIISRLQDKFRGTWEWEWSGSSWGTNSTPQDCNCSRTLYIGDTLIREIVQEAGRTDTTYYTHSLFSTKSTDWPLYFGFSVESADTTERWVMDNIRESIKAGASVNYLLLNKLAGCVCGCPEERYRRLSTQ